MVKAKDIWINNHRAIIFKTKCNLALLIIIACLITMAECYALSQNIDGTMWTGYIGAMCLLAGVITGDFLAKILSKG